MVITTIAEMTAKRHIQRPVEYGQGAALILVEGVEALVLGPQRIRDIGDAAPQDVAHVLQRLWGGPETLIVVSSDLSHYHDYETARRLDAATASAIEHSDWASLGPNQACGCLAVAGLLLEAGRRGFEARRLSLCNSGDTAGSRDRVVGYGAWMFAQTAR